MARLTLLVVFAAFLGLSSALFVKIEPKEEKCFYYDFIPNNNVQVSLSVARGGLLDIRYKIFDPTDALLTEQMHFEGRDVNDKSFRANAAGTYQFCLDNTMSRYTPKWVQLEINGPCPHAEWTRLPGQNPTETQPKDLVTKDDLSPVESTLQRIDTNLNEIADLQHTYRWREETNRKTAESTNQRVLWYSLLVCGVAIIMTIGQLVVLKRWFRL